MFGIILICISKIAYLRFCIEERSTWEEESFRHNGHYLDKVDMDEKYKNKPLQLASIYENAKKINCPIRNCDLWEDPDYQSTAASGSAAKDSMKRSLVQDNSKFLPAEKKAEERKRGSTREGDG